MAKNKLELIIAGDAKGALRAFGQAGMAGDTFGNKMKGIAKSAALLGGAAIVAGIAAVGVGLVKAGQAAAADAQEQAKLATVLRNTTGATDSQVASMENYITKAMLATNTTDTSLRQAFQNLLPAVKDVGVAQDLMNTAIDISVAKGISVETVATAMGKAYNGNTGALGKLGIATKDAAGAALSFGEIMANAAKTFGGTAAEAANTTAGRMENLKLRFGELQEEIGAKLLPVFDKMLTWVSDHMPEIESTIRTVADKIGTALGFVRDDVIPPLVEAFGKIRTWVDENQEEIKAFWSGVQAAASVMYEFIVDTVVPILVEKLRELYDDIKAPLTELARLFDNITWAVHALTGTVGEGSEFAGIGKTIKATIDISLAPLKLLAQYTQWAVDKFNDLIEVIRRYNNTTPKAHTGGLPASSPARPAHNIPQFASGGMVPGSGPQLAVVHGGERVLTPAQQRTWNMGGVTIIVQGANRPEETADRVMTRFMALGVA